MRLCIGISSGIVSILDRPEGRPQQLDILTGSIPNLVSILDRPEGRPQQANFDREKQEIDKFQSSIAPKDDRNYICSTFTQKNLCFNPRSPRRTTATLPEISLSLDKLVSILDRPEGRPQHNSFLK